MKYFGFIFILVIILDDYVFCQTPIPSGLIDSSNAHNQLKEFLPSGKRKKRDISNVYDQLIENPPDRPGCSGKRKKRDTGDVYDKIILPYLRGNRNKRDTKALYDRGLFFMSFLLICCYY